MKIERLLGITILLLNRKKMTAKELAERFQVSVRTIYRDIDALSLAGIPIVSVQGVHGGIHLLEDYRLDKQVLSIKELTAMSTALKSLLTSYEDSHAEMLLEKVRSLMKEEQHETLLIDYSSWGQQAKRDETFFVMQQAIQDNRLVQFEYDDSEGLRSCRKVEPYTLVKKGRGWYIYAFCLIRDDFRLFKLARIETPVIQDEQFDPKQLNTSELPWNQAWNTTQKFVTLQLAFLPSFRHRMVEMFGKEAVGENSARATIKIPENEGMYDFLMSLGGNVTVIAPERIRQLMYERAQAMVTQYK